MLCRTLGTAVLQTSKQFSIAQNLTIGLSTMIAKNSNQELQLLSSEHIQHDFNLFLPLPPSLSFL